MIYMGNSKMVSHTRISPNKTSPRNHKIDTITIHCIVGQLGVKTLGDIFAPASRKASSNYGVGTDGKIGMYVEEKDRSWCSSNAANDHRAVTIEVASDQTHPYAVNDQTYNALIKLCADICKRNNIKELKWEGNKQLIGNIARQNMTVHRWFSNTACPGDFLYSRMGAIAKSVNDILGGTTKPSPDNNVLYRVQVGAYNDKANAQRMMRQIKASGFEAFITSDAPVKTDKPSKPKKPSNEQIAKEVINGKWGNGEYRTNSLRNAGYDPVAIQRLVNGLL